MICGRRNKRLVGNANCSREERKFYLKRHSPPRFLSSFALINYPLWLMRRVLKHPKVINFVDVPLDRFNSHYHVPYIIKCLGRTFRQRNSGVEESPSNEPK